MAYFRERDIENILWEQVHNVFLIEQNMYEKIENLEIVPHKYVQLISCKDAKAVQWRDDSFFQQILFNSYHP